MRSAAEIDFRLRQEAANAALRWLSPAPRGAARAPLAGLPDPTTTLERLRGTAFAAEVEHDFVGALWAAQQKRGLVRADFIHETEDGPLHLLVSRTVGKGWLARFQGRELDGRREFRTAVGAKRWLARSFAEMFPKHRCTRRCRAAPQPSGLGD